MPTFLAMCHGGICRVETRARIDRAHGRTSSYVMSDIGAMEFGRWQTSHFRWQIGATSRVNVGVGVDAATAGTNASTRRPTPTTPDSRAAPRDAILAASYQL